MIGLEAGEGGFVLRFKGRPFLVHSRRRPAVLAGRGEGRYASSRGSFRIRDSRREVEPLRGFAVLESGPERAVLAFSGAKGESLRAVFAVEEGRLALRFEGASPGTNRLVLRLAAPRGERVYGCGEQYSHFQLRGKRIPLWTEEQGVGRGPNLMKLAADLAAGAGGSRTSTYFPIPAFLCAGGAEAGGPEAGGAEAGGASCVGADSSGAPRLGGRGAGPSQAARSGGRSIYAKTSAYAVFDFRRPSSYSLEFWEVPEVLWLDSGDSLPGLVGRLSLLGGRQPPLPEWAYDGLILGAQGGAAEVARKAGALRAAGAPLAGIWAQDWEGQRITSFGKQLRWNWEADEGLYPGIAAFAARLRAEGLRLLGYVNPFLAVDGGQYAEVSPKGYCVKRKDGSDYLVTITTFPAAMLDLTNPAAFAWIKGVIKENLLGSGLSGWMADFGEYLPADAVLFSGESGETAHSRYPVLWARANREAVLEAGAEKEALYFCRSGHEGSAPWAPSFWAGDQLVDWSRDDGLPSVVPAALSLGLSGVGNWHADLGGYTTVGWARRSPELLARWAELAAFAPVMRSHEGNRPESNAQAWEGGESLRLVARAARLHAALKPYQLELARDYEDRGLPFLRPLFLHYPEERRLGTRAYEFLYGPDLLVAPVLKAGARSRRLVLPEDEWVHLWSGRVHRGGRARVEAPLGEIPVFFRLRSPRASLFAAIARELG